MSVDDGLRALFRSHLPTLFMQSIETGGTGQGIPDTHYIRAGISGWIEYKKTDAWAVPLEAEQVAWISRYVRYGGRAYVAVRRRHAGGPRKGAPTDELHIYHGRDSPRLRAVGLRADGPLLRADGGPARWPWPTILALLT